MMLPSALGFMCLSESSSRSVDYFPIRTKQRIRNHRFATKSNHRSLPPTERGSMDSCTGDCLAFTRSRHRADLDAQNQKRDSYMGNRISNLVMKIGDSTGYTALKYILPGVSVRSWSTIRSIRPRSICEATWGHGCTDVHPFFV
jgi:hypothetical protein